MIPLSTIDEAIKRLVKAYDPLEIYLYGDYAWGTPTEDSHLDLLIVIKSSDEEAYKRGYLAFEALLGLKIPKNIIVFTQEEFEKYSQDKLSDFYKIKTKGKIAYARA
ncbi:nucleotidyltransferase domain-containing protein [Candidatus Babeliales bacterium]|nr:nucleotidyltransferase domain-containing protein [Candidatus Babeliales bacterium]